MEGELKKINLGKFLVNANSWGTESPDSKVKNSALAKVERKKESITKLGYLGDASLLVDRDASSEAEGAVVYKVSEKLKCELQGVYDEYAIEGFEEVGTLLKIKGKWQIINSLESIEAIRRQREFDKMEKGNLQIGNMFKVDEYKAHLKTVDAENNGMRTRGHGIQ
jgi:hypothetical protein